ncbi:MAG: Bll4831 protein, partial [uncultured Microvirga sp.]
VRSRSRQGAHGSDRGRRRPYRDCRQGRGRPDQADQEGQRLPQRPPPLHLGRARRDRRGRPGPSFSQWGLGGAPRRGGGRRTSLRPAPM